MKVRELAFYYVDGLHYKCKSKYCIALYKSKYWWIIHKISWMAKKQKTTINPKDKNDNMCFKDAVMFTLNHEKIQKDLQRISKIETF